MRSSPWSEAVVWPEVRAQAEQQRSLVFYRTFDGGAQLIDAFIERGHANDDWTVIARDAL